MSRLINRFPVKFALSQSLTLDSGFNHYQWWCQACRKLSNTNSCCVSSVTHPIWLSETVRGNNLSQGKFGYIQYKQQLCRAARPSDPRKSSFPWNEDTLFYWNCQTTQLETPDIMKRKPVRIFGLIGQLCIQTISINIYNITDNYMNIFVKYIAPLLTLMLSIWVKILTTHLSVLYFKTIHRTLEIIVWQVVLKQIWNHVLGCSGYSFILLQGHAWGNVSYAFTMSINGFIMKGYRYRVQQFIFYGQTKVPWPSLQIQHENDDSIQK